MPRGKVKGKDERKKDRVSLSFERKQRRKDGKSN